MKALSVKQPWATLIAAGHKTAEIRTWKTGYRGKLLICASKTIDREAMRECLETGDVTLEDFPTGVAVGIVDLVDCVPGGKEHPPLALCDVYEGDWAWIVANAKEIEPFPVKGALHLFEVNLQ